jgi:hypothetical protein
MGSIGNVPNGISYLAATLGAASGSSTGNTNSQDLENLLQSATPSDAVVLSSAALQLQQIDGIFGLPSPGSQDSSFAAPGISPADLAKATPDQLAAIAAQAQSLTQQTSLFTPAPSYQGKVNVLA